MQDVKIRWPPLHETKSEVWDDPARFKLDFDLFPVQPVLEGPRFRVPDSPGLGVEFNEELAASQSFKFWEAPHLHRRDGSHRNW